MACVTSYCEVVISKLRSPKDVLEWTHVFGWCCEDAHCFTWSQHQQERTPGGGVDDALRLAQRRAVGQAALQPPARRSCRRLLCATCAKCSRCCAMTGAHIDSPWHPAVHRRDVWCCEGISGRQPAPASAQGSPCCPPASTSASAADAAKLCGSSPAGWGTGTTVHSLPAAGCCAAVGAGTGRGVRGGSSGAVLPASTGRCRCSLSASAAARWCAMCCVRSVRGDASAKGSGRMGGSCWRTGLLGNTAQVVRTKPAGWRQSTAYRSGRRAR
jgi:hypothetical protein